MEGILGFCCPEMRCIVTFKYNSIQTKDSSNEPPFEG